MRPRPERPYPDYTTDLNALARLEGKLPPHSWSMGQAPDDDGWAVSLYVLDSFGMFHSQCEATEAEARAEAICQYLEANDDDLQYTDPARRTLGDWYKRGTW